MQEDKVAQSGYERYLSKRASYWRPSSIRGLFKLETPSTISFLAGKPNVSVSPILGLSVDVEGKTVKLDDAAVAEACSYTQTIGLPRMRKWYSNMLQREHGRTYDEVESQGHVGAGSSDLLNKLFLAILDPGDVLIVETPVYAIAESILRIVPHGEDGEVDVLEAETDGEGLVPESLEQVLTEAKSKGKRVKALYMVPTGSNPTGATAPLERRKRILALCEQHDILIIEDDPYWFLHYSPADRPSSYYSLDKTGRVLRLDSLSKVVAAGLRLGFLVGPKPILDAIENYSGNTNLQPSSAIAIAVLNNIDFDAHVRRVADFYRRQRDDCAAAVRQHLDGVATFTLPAAGMFLYLHAIGIKDSYDMLLQHAHKAGVLACPGVSFRAKGTSGSLRISFSLSTREQLDIALPRLRKVILETQKEQSGQH